MYLYFQRPQQYVTLVFMATNTRQRAASRLLRLQSVKRLVSLYAM